MMLESRMLHRSIRQSRLRIQPLLPLRTTASQRHLSAAPARQTHHASRNLAQASRTFRTAASSRISILEKDDKSAEEPDKAEDHVVSPTPLSDDAYHELSDQYLDQLFEELEQKQEDRGDIDVEFNSGVLTVTHSSSGTYVLNKQPPNKQIWLSSPISGPKRYDWVVSGDSMHEKGGEQKGEWTYLRDGSSLTRLLRKELDVRMSLWMGEED